MIRLEGRRVLVTGGSRGIGRASVRLFAAAGADVALTYVRNRSAAEEARREVESLGREALVCRAEMADKADADRLAAEVLGRWGRLDVLVNNAGVWTYLTMGELDPAVLRETLAVNLEGLFYVTNAFVPAMKAAGGGAVITVSSTAGVRGEAGHSHYAATKGAVHAFTKSLAVELAPWNIRVNAVAPGWVDTDMCTEIFRDAAFKEKVRLSIPLRRIPPPEDVAGPILFLASDLARHVTGEILDVNGGSVLCGG